MASATWSPNHSLTPRKLRGLVRKLNYFGGVAISEDAVEFDGDKVEWADMEEVRTRSLIEYMFTGGLESQIDKLPVPWFPFRRKVLGAISRAALTLLLAAAKQQLEGGAMDIRIPAEVHYRGMLRSRELTPGMLAAVILADPAVRRVLRGDRAGARRHGASRRGRRHGGRRRARRADQVDAGQAPRPPPLVICVSVAVSATRLTKSR